MATTAKGNEIHGVSLYVDNRRRHQHALFVTVNGLAEVTVCAADMRPSSPKDTSG